MTPMSRLFRRFNSFRKPRSTPVSTTVASPNSCPNLHETYCGKNAQPTCSLSDAIIFKILDNIEDPFELANLRRVNRLFRDYVDQRFANIIDMDVRRVAFDRLSISSCVSENSCSSSSSSSSTQNDNTIVLNQNQTWFLHPTGGYKLLIRFKENSRVEILVDECWTSKEVIILCKTMQMFRMSVKHITIDAPIAELIIASLSLIDLERWYAFQCYLQAINDPKAHLRFPSTTNSSNDKNSKSSFYWPQAETIIIRTTKDSSVHLGRLLDYGVRSELLFNRCKINELRIVLTDATNDVKTNRSLNRNLYHFRCWAGSAGFDDRFNQQYSVNVV